MIGSQVGSYRIERELGQGAMGTVYLAEVIGEAPGLMPGERVAIKIVHPHLLSTPGFFKRFLREAEAGRQIQHANVVRTFDADATVVDGRQLNFLVMEYVEGRNLRSLQQDLGTVPETLLLEIAEQLAAGIAAIHECGIIHRDLKPENVLITDDQRIRIMDLGVAKMQEASVALTREGQFAGSFLYAAPEQFQGHAVGPASDLYSLGVLLYELVSGENPFRRDETAAIIQAHLQMKPPRLLDRVPECSGFVSEVIAALLEKAPDHRLESAGALHVLLQEGESSSWWATRERRVREGQDHLPSIQVARDTRLHGREKELALMKAAWGQAVAGEGTVLLLEGEPGIGKTRLVDAFVKQCGTEDAHLLYGTYPPSGGMGGLSDSIIGKFGAVNLEESLHPYITATPALVPAFAALVKHETPPDGVTAPRGDSLHTVTCHLMRGLAAEKPTLWILDDLHFAPSESRQLVLSMARAVAPHRILLLLTAREGLPEEDLAHLGKLPKLQRIPLQRLGAREVIDLLSEALQSERLAEKLGGKIARKSDGVPFFVIEMIRDLRSGGLLARGSDGTYSQTQPITNIEVPSAVKDLIVGRLNMLTREERAILDVGAVQGNEFDPDLVARVLDQRRVRILQDLAEIERRTGVVRAARRAYRFDQYQIQELILADISEVLREDYHSLLAEKFAAREGIEKGAVGEAAHFLARHGLHGTEPRRGLVHLEPALEYLSAAGRVDAGIGLAQRALDVPGLVVGADRCRVLMAQVLRWHALGQRGEERRLAREAQAVAEEVGDTALRVWAHVRLARSFENTPRLTEGVAVAETAHGIARAGGDVDLERVCLQTLASLCWQLRLYEPALRYAQHSAGLDDGPPKPSIELGIILHNLGRYGEARVQYEGLVAEQGARAATALGNIALIHSVLGDFERARKDFERALESARANGFSGLGYFLHELGELAEREGRVEDAKENYASALRDWRESGRLDDVGLTLVAQGRLALREGDTQTARDVLDQALVHAAEFRHPGATVLGSVYRARLPNGDVRSALAAVSEYEARCRHREKIEARYVLYELTGEREHLEKAHALTEYLREQSPEALRDLMPNNRLFRDVWAAWEALRSAARSEA